MADREGGGSSWIAFLAGIILVAIVAVGIIAYSGGLQPRQEAELEIETPNINPPDVNIESPDVDLPSPPPAPTTPPSAEPAPAETTTP